LLDYDGTLAPFKENPAEARVYPGVEARLGEIFKVSRLVIVTGRSLASILTLLKIDPLPEIWASHGREHRLPGGEVRAALPHEDQREGLRAGREALGAARIPGRVEEKPFSVAFHVRGLERGLGEESMARVREIWFPLIRGGGLEIFPFNGGLELRAPGRSKGDAVSELIGGAPGTPVAYLGDDETDEDAFRALGERGLCVLVRGEWRPTLARVWLRPPGELMEFLGRWLEACRRI
jgi:trehalose-phosphatase